MHLLGLPDDILLEIFRRLDGDSVYTSSKVCKTLHAFIMYHGEFEYKYRLEKQGMINTCIGGRSYESKIEILKQFTSHWWKSINGTRLPSEVYEIHGGCIAYELVAGVFAKSDGSSLTIQWLRSFETPSRQLIRSQNDIGFSIKDFALDPTQDLIVFIEADHLPFSSPRGRDINLHIRTLSTHVNHPNAEKPVIYFRLPYNPQGNDLSAVTIQLVDDILSLFFSSGPGLPRLLLWDWKTATLILNSMKSGLSLPTGSQTFEILSSRSYAILSPSNGGSIYIYNIDYPRTPIVPPFCVAKLLLPALLPGIQLATLHSHTGPFLGRPRRDGIFTTDPEARVYVLATRYLNTTRTHATIFVHGAAFAPYTKIKHRPDKIPEIAWTDWSHRKIFFAPFHLATNWLRYVQGTRVAISMDIGRGHVAVFDFHLDREPTQDDPKHNFDLFMEDIIHILPPRRQTLSFETTCTSFMVDEDLVLGLNTLGNFEERIRSLEAFSMYHPGGVRARTVLCDN